MHAALHITEQELCYVDSLSLPNTYSFPVTVLQ